MRASKFSLWCVTAGLVVGLAGSASVLAQEKGTRAPEEMINAWRGRASAPVPTGPVEVKPQAVGTAGITEAPERPTDEMVNAWRGRASPPSPTRR